MADVVKADVVSGNVARDSHQRTHLGAKNDSMENVEVLSHLPEGEASILG